VDRLIVDGYNVIFAWPELAAIKDVKLEDARDLLIAILADYGAVSRQRITVVFDSHRRSDAQPSTEEISGVEVVYSGGKTSADHVIERLIYAARSTDSVTVATSDGVQRDMALGKGVKTISAPVLKKLVDEALAGRDVEIKDRDARSQLARRLEDRIDPTVREQLERIRRGEEK
jgi:predicted RNA-binding protein with PIN domain